MHYNNSEKRNEARAWVLRLMEDNVIRTRQQIYTETIELAQICEDELALTFPFGQSKVENSIAWAITSLTKAGILNRLGRATYKITETGLILAEQWKDKTAISEKEFIGLPAWEKYRQSIAERKQNKLDENDDSVTPEMIFRYELDYEHQAIQAITELETELAVELLEKLRQETPVFFEKAVIQLLLAMGYGGKEKLALHVGKSHDGGIDGVIKQDPLGIQNIYIQAKRYADGNTIGINELQSFSGALQGHGVERGVFITTSSYTKSAKEYAERLLGKIVLIDGQRLATLMIKYKVGIQIKRTLEICEIDEDFFE